jgi:HTH-type transcriptional regulator / antitoxin HigA
MPQSEQLFDTAPVHPGKILREMMAAKGWTQDELAIITGISRQTIYMILAGKSNVSAESAVRFAAAFGNSPEEWIRWDGLYRLSVLSEETDVTHVGSLAKLYDLAPVREMMKRGWIRPNLNPTELQRELEAFYEADSLEHGMRFPIAAKRTVTLDDLNPAEVAWVFRARQLSKTLLVPEFKPERMTKLFAELKKLAAHPKEARHAPTVLAEYGIRFLIVEPLPAAKIDGAAFWIEAGPVIALSLRHDRMDGFWFTLMHECSHIRHGDPLSVDAGLIDETKGIAVTLVENEAERRANKEAADSLVAAPEMDSFIRRVGPLYQKARVIQFANRLRIHPSVIVGQLQYRKELTFGSMREVLVKVREYVTATTLTDGWGHMIPLPELGG